MCMPSLTSLLYPFTALQDLHAATSPHLAAPIVTGQLAGAERFRARLLILSPHHHSLGWQSANLGATRTQTSTLVT